MDILIPEASDFEPRARPDYIDVGLVSFLDRVSFSSPLILTGPKGVGKTEAVEKLAEQKGYLFVPYSCSSETGRVELVGSTQLRNENGVPVSIFEPGALAIAILLANAAIDMNPPRKVILFLDEMTTLTPESQKILNSLTDRQASVSRGPLRFSLADPERLWVVGSANPRYGGTYDINEDLASRFARINVEYMKESDEVQVLIRRMGTSCGTDSTQRLNIAKRLVTLAGETRAQGSSAGKHRFGYALSTRDLLQVTAHMSKGLSIAESLIVLRAKFPEKDVDHFNTRCGSIFGSAVTTIKEQKLW